MGTTRTMYTSTPETEQPFNNIRQQLEIMERALKRNQIETTEQRNQLVDEVSELIETVKETEINYTVPNIPSIKRAGGLATLTHIVKQGKAKLVDGLQDLQTAIKRKEDKQATRIIRKIKENEMYQLNARNVVKVWKQQIKPFETEYKNHKVK